MVKHCSLWIAMQHFMERSKCFLQICEKVYDMTPSNIDTVRRSYATVVLHGSRNSVRPSVRLSVTRVLCD